MAKRSHYNVVLFAIADEFLFACIRLYVGGNDWRESFLRIGVHHFEDKLFGVKAPIFN
ncbi:MAG: hypothetical protein Q8T09_06535 [Candidatus Melainabacteria bacterium]|nr:hypothetical protein [Candidatus Melainabacteria bacterium]